MSTFQAIHGQALPSGSVPLENGERTDQKTFHTWYQTTPDGFKAELIAGEVVVASPLKVSHSEHHGLTMYWLWSYALETPGTRPRDNATAILGEDSEPQPDAALIVEPSHGGQTGVDDDGYATGAPEFVGEIANSSGSIDLHRKKQDYERAGVKEYAVVLLREQQVRWFVLRGGTFHDMPPNGDGIYRSVVFPGLWLDAAALLRLDGAGIAAALRLGLASPEHAAFVLELAARTRS
jgi:Uma2 family endonuclease